MLKMYDFHTTILGIGNKQILYFFQFCEDSISLSVFFFPTHLFNEEGNFRKLYTFTLTVH